jgi:hypothetical protein
MAWDTPDEDFEYWLYNVSDYEYSSRREVYDSSIETGEIDSVNAFCRVKVSISPEAELEKKDGVIVDILDWTKEDFEQFFYIEEDVATEELTDEESVETELELTEE